MSTPINALNSMLKTLEERADAFHQAEVASPLLAVVDGRATVTSLQIAEHFDKRHDNVLRAIRDLMDKLPADWLSHFEETLFEVPGPNGAVRQEPAYRITRDGFTLLAMGFTGDRALAFKLAYIAAFNKREKALQAAATPNAMIGRATGLPTKQLCILQDQSWKLIQRLERTKQADVRAVLYSQLVDVCADMGHTAPPLQALGHETPPQPDAVTEFWTAFHALQNAGVKVNHSHKPGLIAVHLKQFMQLAVAHGLPLAKSPELKEALHLSLTPQFVETRTVRSVIVGSPIHCWLFQADPQTGSAA